MKLVSVIIPVYNTAEYLPRCLESILSNTYSNLELICINDGSTDNSLNVLNYYANLDSRIIVINQQNSGVSASRNVGLDHASGEYIAFIDSDDWIHSCYFEQLMQIQAFSNTDIVICDIESVYNSTEGPESAAALICNKNVEILSMEDVLRGGFLKHSVVSRIYRKSIISSIRFDNHLSWGEDTSFNFKVLSDNAGLRIAHFPHSMYYYVRHSSSLSHSLNSSQQILLAQWYLQQASSLYDQKLREIMLEQACKEGLANRYTAKLSKNKKDILSCKLFISDCWRIARSREVLPIKKRVKYGILFAFPCVYRLFRIINDPTLLYWEKTHKPKD